ncbi:MAG: hypothetical protein LC650_05510 [Actinobacteria bacterium]|nr:hypothetical protein [Actinomycetota bacterium]
MKSIIEQVRSHSKYNSLAVNNKNLMKSLGVDLENKRFLDLGTIPNEEVSDLIMKSLMWMETINELLGTVKKANMDQKLEVESVFNRAMRNLPEKVKVSEAKAEAKSNPEYISAEKNSNLLSAYVDYLSRLLDNLDKYHYVLKSRIDHAKNIERKY